MSTTTPPPAPAPAPPAPAKKSNTLLIVLCIVFGVILLLLGSCVATCVYVGKKAKNYAEETGKNPELSALSLMAAVHPDLEVVSKDFNAGLLVLKNKKTGETVKIDARDLSKENIEKVLERIVEGKGINVGTRSVGSTTSSSDRSVSAAESDAMKATLKKFPADFPSYTGGGATTLEANQQSFGGMSSSQQVFQTADSPADVAEYYSQKMKAAGYSLAGSENGSDDNGPTVSSIFQKDGIAATLTVTARIEGGKTRVEVTHVLLKQP